MRQPLEYIFPDPPMGIDPKALDQSRIPRHVAVIMDGNGRWAKKRALNRLRGHKAGIEAVRETIRCANDCGVELPHHLFVLHRELEASEGRGKRPVELFAKTMLAGSGRSA